MLIAVVLLGLLLRLNGYAELPGATANADEWGIAWAGLTLLTAGTPTSWSYLGAYHAHQLIYLHGTVYPLVTPWLDHPPLFPVLVGLSQLAFGQHTIFESTTAAIRLPAVLLGTVSIALTHAVGRRLLGPPAGITSALLLAVSPAAVLLSREVETDALLAPLLLTAILLLHRLGSGEGGRATVALLALDCMLASLTKAPGLAVGAAAAVVLLWRGRWDWAALCLGGALAGLGVYALLGAHYDWSLFTSVISSQGNRRSGVLGAFEFIASPAGVNHRLRDGWWLLGWIGVAGLLAGRGSPKQWLLAWPVVAYLLAILVFADERVVARYGWYHIAVYPAVYLAAGHLVWRALWSPNPTLLGLVLALGGASATSLWLGAPWLPPAGLLVAILAVVLLPAAVPRLRPAARVIAAAALAAVLVGSTVEALSLDTVMFLS